MAGDALRHDALRHGTSMMPAKKNMRAITSFFFDNNHCVDIAVIHFAFVSQQVWFKYPVQSLYSSTTWMSKANSREGGAFRSR